MKQSKATCTNVEGLLPLFVGGDLEQEDNASVGLHIDQCAVCKVLFERARAARNELRLGLERSVDNCEPQLWPTIREELSREGLLRVQAGSLPVESAQVGRSPAPGGEGERRFYNRQGFRFASGLAASLALIFLADRNFNSGFVEPASAGPGAAGVLDSSSGGVALNGAGSQGSALESSATLPTKTVAGAGLRPVGLSEVPLFDLAREQIQREQGAYASGGIFLKPMQPVPNLNEGDLASSFSLQ